MTSALSPCAPPFSFYCLDCHVLLPGTRDGAEAFLFGSHVNHRYTQLSNANANIAVSAVGQLALPLSSLRHDVESYHTCVTSVLRTLDGHALLSQARADDIRREMAELRDELTQLTSADGLGQSERSALKRLAALGKVGRLLHGNLQNLREECQRGGKLYCSSSAPSSVAAAAMLSSSAADAEMEAIAKALQKDLTRLSRLDKDNEVSRDRSWYKASSPPLVGNASGLAAGEADGTSFLRSPVASGQAMLTTLFLGGGGGAGVTRGEGSTESSESRSESMARRFTAARANRGRSAAAGLVNSRVGTRDVSFADEAALFDADPADLSSSCSEPPSLTSCGSSSTSITPTRSASERKSRSYCCCCPMSSKGEQNGASSSVLSPLPDVTLRAQFEFHERCLELFLKEAGGNTTASASNKGSNEAAFSSPSLPFSSSTSVSPLSLENRLRSPCVHVALQKCRRVLKAAAACGDDALLQEGTRSRTVRKAVKYFS